MHRLRNIPALRRLATVLAVLGLLLQGMAMPLAAALPDGICHGGSPAPQPAQHVHDGGCVLCHLQTAAPAAAGPRLPLPRTIAARVMLLPPRGDAAPGRAAAAYASRAPPRG